MKKLLKEIPAFAISFYVSYVLISLIINGFKFKESFLTDPIFILIGATIGWSIVRYFQIKKENK